MQRGTQGHMTEPRKPTQEAWVARVDADAWQGPRESTRTPGGSHVASEGLACEGPTG